MTNYVINSKKGKWLVTKSKWATVFVRPVKDKWDERTTTVYREMFDVVKLGIIKSQSKVPHPETYNWEVRYYKDCPHVIGDKTLPDDRSKPKQLPEYALPTFTYDDAIGLVLDAIGYPRDNAKLKEFLE